ncbi:PREDICTED: reticulocalbin-2-like [Priapulus caudatus]|uniref:Reticulocalbin-2-like n=1 Tax=Priapulus caudatus TaxID=37621 RepID=A0ABM1E0D2_PRICU|nr:PREDICTED: reticulocalbin-2-like [Priapulus caudatus]
MESSRVFLLICLCGFLLVAGRAPPLDHVHGEVNKERMRDGAPTPRDAHHYHDDVHNDDFDHEVILGSQEQVELFESLSREAAREKLAELVDRMDADADGFVDTPELTAWIKKSFLSLSLEESDDRFEEVDEDENGEVTLREVMEDYGVFDDEDEVEVLTNEPELAAEMKKDERLFSVADADGDGVLKKAEFFAFSHPEEHEQMWDVLMTESLNEKDKDSDGKLDLDEFLGDDKDQHDKEWATIERKRFAEYFDRNSDGYLDKEEMLLWLVPNNEEMARDEAEHLISSADDDGDGRLSISEILDHQDMFVGSRSSISGHHDEF